ncbi:retrovirus-related pol polyprotein from transposon TNT 1-94, partial [Tanacetum coccineum]
SESEVFCSGKSYSRNGGAQNRAGNANASQGKLVKCYNCNGVRHIARNCTQPKRPQNSDYFKDKMLLMQAQKNGAVLDEEELLFLADLAKRKAEELKANASPLPVLPPAIVTFEGIQKSLVTEVRAMKAVFENLEAEVDQNETDLRSGRTDHSLVFGLRLLKYMTGNRSRLRNFIKKFIGTVRFGNDHFGAIMGYGDYVIGDSGPPLVSLGRSLWTTAYNQNDPFYILLTTKPIMKIVHDKKPDLSLPMIFFWGSLLNPQTTAKSWANEKLKLTLGSLLLIEQKAPVYSSLGPNPNLLTPGPISLRLVPNSAPAILYVPPTNKDLELLLQPMFDEYFETPTGYHQMTHVPAVPPLVILTGPSISISFDHDASSSSHSPSSSAHQSSSVHHGVATKHSFKVNPFAATEHEPFVNVFAPDPNSKASSFGTLTMNI